METKLLKIMLCHWCVIELAMARLDLDLSYKTCGSKYNMEDIEEAYVTFNPELIVENICLVKFTNINSFTLKQACVKPLNFTLDCNTIVEFHAYMNSNHLTTERIYTCHNASFKDWCVTKRTTHFLLIFRKIRKLFSSSESVRLKVYLQNYTGEDHSSQTVKSNVSSSGASIVHVVLSLCLVMFAIGFVIIYRMIRRQRMQWSLHTSQYKYQTTTGQIGIEAAGQFSSGTQHSQQTCYQPLLQTGDQSPQECQFQSAFQGHYEIHDLQPDYTESTQGRYKIYNPLPGCQLVSQTEKGYVNPIMVDEEVKNLIGLE